jgi:hypothetical protein
MSDVRMELGAVPAMSEVAETPSAGIIADANRAVQIKSESGKMLSVKRGDDMLKRFRLARVLGGEDAANAAMMSHALIAVSVVAIDGVPISFPKTVPELEFLIGRLNVQDIAAISKVQKDEFGIGVDAETVEEAKN